MRIGKLRTLRDPRAILLVALLAPAVASARGTAQPGVDADEDLEDIGARATGAGLVGVANPNDIGALRLNIATASLTERYEIYTGAELGPLAHFALRGGAMDSRSSPVALALGYRHVHDERWLWQDERPGWMTPDSTFQNPTDHQGLYAGLAYPFSNRKASVAVDARYDWYVSDLLDQASAFNFGVSGAWKPADSFVLAAALDNLLETNFRDTSRQLRLGARWDAGQYFGLEGDVLAPVTTTWDWKKLDWRVGANVGFAQFVAIRAGYANEATKNWVTGGVGFTSPDCDLDYGVRVRIDDPFHNVHTLDVRVRF